MNASRRRFLAAVAALAHVGKPDSSKRRTKRNERALERATAVEQMKSGPERVVWGPQQVASSSFAYAQRCAEMFAEVSRKLNGRYIAKYKGHTAYGKTPDEAIRKVRQRAS